jgi:hypothetical protein
LLNFNSTADNSLSTFDLDGALKGMNFGDLSDLSSILGDNDLKKIKNITYDKNQTSDKISKSLENKLKDDKL